MMPVTQSQSLIHMGQALAGTAPLYNMAWRFDLHLDLDPSRFAQAFESVVGDNDAMRSTFKGGGPGLEQIPRDAPLPFPPPLDFSAEEDPQGAAASWIEQRARRPIDLSQTTYDSCLIKLEQTHWVWFFCQHHIATDAWSGGLFFKAVSDAYQGLPLSKASQFGSYAEAETKAREDGSLEVSLAHWQAKTRDHASSTVPYGSSRNLSVSASRRISIPFGQERTKALKALSITPPFRSISPDLSVFTLLSTAYVAFLHRTTGDQRITIGAPSHNRATPDLKATMGLFIEMFPLGVEIEDQDTFETLYARILAEVMGYLRHAKPGASSAATASLFNAVLNFIPVDYGRFADSKTDIQWLHPGAHDAGHDMRLHVYDFRGSGAYTVEADLNSAVFEQNIAKTLPDHFLSLFDALLGDATQEIADVPLRPAPDTLKGPKRKVIHKSILEAIQAQICATPDAIALESPVGALSYTDLNAQADGFAALLPTGQPVVIHATRSNELVIAILGALKAGAPFVPLAADTPPDRVKAIVEQLAPSHICLDAGTIHSLGDLDLPVLNLEALPDASSAQGPTPDASDPAYMIFTSGSTGTPKGVVVDYQGLGAYVDWAAQSFGAEGPKSYPLYSSIGFDLTITSLFVPLVTGGRIVVYPETKGGADLSILDVMREDRVDVVKLTPSHLALSCEVPQSLTRIKTLILGGENLTTALCRAAQSKLRADLEIINEYGPTEAVVGCMIHRFDARADQMASVPIGLPADNMHIHVLDAGLNPVPIGVTGEIYIQGRLATGYFGRDDLTGERFITHPVTKARLYKSGDLARQDGEGSLHYLGRSDTQVKIGGIRIEPAEVEAALKTIPGISAAHVTTYARAVPKTETRPQSCTRCGITDDVPGTSINAAGVCSICEGFEAYKERAEVYFKTPEALQTLVDDLPGRKTGQYDAIVLLSGGKDSTYALYRFAELTSNILTLTLDNGYISDEAKANITRVVDDLGVDHRFLTTPAMNAIFADSLTRHSNVCQGCFKTIYTLALRVARDEGIPAIVTGLSRGQFFETRLTPELFENQAPSAEQLEDFVLDARKSYHRMDDAIAGHLNTSDLHDDQLFEDIAFIDVYRYIDVPVEEIYSFLSARAPWVRPGDTGRSTNCLINDAGIYVHLRREGYHNYALPYSWDVRMGHKTRAEAVEELNDAIDPARVQEILGEVGFDTSLTGTKVELVAYIVGDSLKDADIRALLAQSLPRAMIPSHIIRLEHLPLTGNGKVDGNALPAPDIHRPQSSRANVSPQGPAETQLVQIFRAIIGGDQIGVTDNFYDIGGDSIAAIQIAMEASRAGLNMAPNALFEHQTIRELARNLGPAPEAAPEVSQPLVTLGETDMAALARQLGGA